MCGHFGRCGGCSYLDISYEEELALKQNALQETLGEPAPLLPAPQTHSYRNKMEFAFGDTGKDGALALGIRKKRSFYEVATPVDCVLICEDFKKIVMHTIDFFTEKGETFHHRKRRTGTLRHLVLRRGENTGEMLVLLSATSALANGYEDAIQQDLTHILREFAEELLHLQLDGKIVGIFHATNDGAADAVKNENITSLYRYGRNYYNEKICGLDFKVSMFSFFQTNTHTAEILYSIVREFAATAPANNTALDLFCGTGTIAQIISPLFKEVIGVELIPEAVSAATENAVQNKITNCTFHAGDAFAVISAQNLAPDCIIVDPPRDGLSPKIIQKIGTLAAPTLIYVACKPKSLARDLPLLQEAGYSPIKIQAVDMFPRTPHVECVALLRYY